MTRPGARAAATLAVALLASATACARRSAHAAPSPQALADSLARLPGAARDRDTTAMVAPARLAQLPAERQAAWAAYVARSDSARARDRALIDGELRAAGMTRMVPAPHAPESFTVQPTQLEAGWLRGPEARALATAMLTFQTPSGGWSKHVAYDRGPRRPGQSFFSENDRWSWIATIDNGSTTEQLQLLAALIAATPDAPERATWEAAYRRGLGWLLAAQQPTGCWPQVWPLAGGYHDAVTFNDDALVAVLTALDSAVVVPWLPAAERTAVAGAVQRGHDCVLATQVVRDGRPTAWGQQHDPLTLVPTGARSYEHPSLASKESAAVVDWLMTRPAPDARTVAAVHAAAAWFRATAQQGVGYVVGQGVVERPDAGPVWARMVDLRTDRPIFSNRDGVILTDWRQLTDRRVGYAWFGVWPASTLRRYERWARRHPVAPTTTGAAAR